MFSIFFKITLRPRCHRNSEYVVSGGRRKDQSCWEPHGKETTKTLEMRLEYHSALNGKESKSSSQGRHPHPTPQDISCEHIKTCSASCINIQNLKHMQY